VYAYASTQPYIDPDTGNRKYRHIHRGTVDEGLRFIPGNSFWIDTLRHTNKAKVITPFVGAQVATRGLRFSDTGGLRSYITSRQTQKKSGVDRRRERPRQFSSRK
jgi:hypothetical protein